MIHKDLNDPIVLAEVPRSCSKWIINIFQLSQLMIKLPMESFSILI